MGYLHQSAELYSEKIQPVCTNKFEKLKSDIDFLSKNIETHPHENSQLAFNTLGEVLAHWAKVQPDHKAYTMLDANGMEEDSLTYGELHSKAMKLAQILLSYGLQSRNVILLYPAGIEFIVGFFGCLYAGVVPAPVHPPKRNRSNHKIANLVICTDAAAILLPAAQEQAFREILGGEENWPETLMYIATDTIVNSSVVAESQLPRLDQSRLAFLQFTSGSTSLPKGVMITHKNCLNNLEMILALSKANSDYTFVSWLPHHHDLGLVAHLLMSSYGGGHCIMLAPTTFVSRPIRWLEAISKYRAEYTGAPNFAYQLCIDKIQSSEQQNLDLSCLRMVINAAEPINPQTIKDFTEKFAQNGFESRMFLPAYGMAEATVFISSRPMDDEPVFKAVDWTILGKENIAKNVTDGHKEKVFVGCGNAWLDQEICIVNPDLHRVLPSNHVGEIWVTGPNVMSGYYNNPEATAKTLVCLEGDDRLYLRTGDLGFFDENRELYIAGRLKDMIIVDGENYYPQDIEQCIGQAHPDIRPDCLTAFSVPGDSGEKLVIFIELTRSGVKKINDLDYLDHLVNTICLAFGEQFEIPIHQLIFLRTGQLPKTSSGKVRRQQCKLDFLQGNVDALAKWSPGQITNPQKQDVDVSNIQHIFDLIMFMGSKHLKVFTNLINTLTHNYGIHLVDLDIEKNLLTYGMNSRQLVEIHNSLEKQLGSVIPLEPFFQENTFLEMINSIVNSIPDNDQ